MDASHGVKDTEIFIPERVRRVSNTTERLEADFHKIGTKIHRFPLGLRGIGGQGERYIIPSLVALGPYHHSLHHLQEMEEVKDTAAHNFCTQSGHSVEEVYSKILSITGEARGCYPDDAVTHFSNAEFAAMMFLDGCFLLQYLGMDYNADLYKNCRTMSTMPCMFKDIFLMENQLPWLVLDALMEFTNVSTYQLVAGFTDYYASMISSSSKPMLSMDEFKRYTPPHILGLFRYYLVVRMPQEEYITTKATLVCGAIELAEIGIKLTASNNTWFSDMSFQKGSLFSEICLTPLFLSDYTACWLVNMAAFEVCMCTSFPNDGYTISSYLSILAMLMDKKEDVHELRAKHLVHSLFSNREMLDFFKDLARHVRLGHRHLDVVAKIQKYKLERPRQIAVNKFFYNNFKIIVALLSIASVLGGIFKTLLSLKQHQQ